MNYYEFMNYNSLIQPSLQIDNSLDWKYHVSVLSSQVSKPVSFLKHDKYILPSETLNKLYAGIVELHFRCCCSMWACRCVTKKSTCRICKIELQKGIPFVCRLGWKAIEEFIAHESELIVFKSLHGLAPQYMNDLFKKISQLTAHSLCNIATNLWSPQKISSTGQKCFSYRGAKTWNSLPTKCKQAIARHDFKSYL